jgi:hypothetical protein
LVEAVMPFLDEWQALLKDIRQLTPERVGGMLDRAEHLRNQADAAGQGAVVHHVEVCIELLKAPGLDRRGFQEALRNLSEVTWQLKQEVGAPPRRGSAVPPELGPQSMARPPLLSDLGSPQPPGPVMLGSRSGIQAPPPISLQVRAPSGAPPLAKGPSFESPPNIDRSLNIDIEGLAAPAPPPAAVAPPPRAFEPMGPSIIPRAGGARPPAPRPPAEGPFASPPILSGRARPSPVVQKAKDKPNLMVATMFGLRAFGRGKGGPPAGPPAASAPPAAVIQQKKGVLGLGRGSRREPSDAPAWIGPREGGLPELATGGSGPSPGGAARDLDERLRKLRAGDDPRDDEPGVRRSSRPSKSSEADRVRSSSSSQSDLARGDGRREAVRPRERAFPVPWWIGGVAVALVGLIVVGVLVFGRSSLPTPAQQAVPAGGSGTDTELPTSRLLEQKERMKALISLVHGYGGEESPELADLLNEEAALVYEVLERSCKQPGDKCERSVPIVAGTVRSGATPQNEMRHLFEDRKIAGTHRSGGQVPKWLAGLSTPAIGVEDDPNVRRWVEYYTTNHVGREDFQNMLFRCGAYQDLIEKTLVHYGMPRALLALVMTESGCVPHAESPVGARGLWQFMPATARAYHLAVKDGVIDERISPPKSTEAAVKFLADLYRKMGSWEFALASYNMGPFGLSARIRRAGGDVTFWDLAAAGFLPEETAKYVPRIQAYALILENLGRFNFSTAQMRATEVTAELEAPPGTRLGMVARAASTSLDHLKLLNPDIVGTFVPDLPGSRFMVQVPKEDVFRARSLLEQLLAAGDQNDRCVSSAFDWGSERFTEKMCSGKFKAAQ